MSRLYGQVADLSSRHVHFFLGQVLRHKSDEPHSFERAVAGGLADGRFLRGCRGDKREDRWRSCRKNTRRRSFSNGLMVECNLSVSNQSICGTDVAMLLTYT